MHAHGYTIAKRREQIVIADPLLITRMADLMDRGIEAIERITQAGARGDAHIKARAGGERMHRFVDAAMAHVVAEGLGKLARQLHLLAFIKVKIKIGRLL